MQFPINKKFKLHVAVFCTAAAILSVFLVMFSHSANAQRESLEANMNAAYFSNSSNEVNENQSGSVRLAQRQRGNSQSDSSTNMNANNQCEYLSENLRIDFDNDEEAVERLQRFLQAYGYEDLSVSGEFTPETLQAVRAFQVDNASDVLEPWGYEPREATGYVYITTRQKINEIYCDESFALSDSQESEVQDFSQQLNEFKQDGANFETPQYLTAYYESNPNVRQLTALPQRNNGEITTAEREALANQQDVNSLSENNESSGFFANLFGGNNSDDSDQTTTSADDESVGNENTVNEEVVDEQSSTSATGTAATSSATSGIDQAAATVYSGVNSIFGFLLSPTFLIVLLIVLILLLIATLFEDEEDVSAKHQSHESGAIGDWTDDEGMKNARDVEAKSAEKGGKDEEGTSK